MLQVQVSPRRLAAFLPPAISSGESSLCDEVGRADVMPSQNAPIGVTHLQHHRDKPLPRAPPSQGRIVVVKAHGGQRIGTDRESPCVVEERVVPGVAAHHQRVAVLEQARNDDDRRATGAMRHRTSRATTACPARDGQSPVGRFTHATTDGNVDPAFQVHASLNVEPFQPPITTTRGGLVCGRPRRRR